MRIHRLTITLLILSFTAAFGLELKQVSMVELPGRPGFDGMAFANNMLLINHFTENRVEIYDPVRRRVIAEVKNVQDPHGIAVDEANGRAYIASSGAKEITVLSTKDWHVLETFPLNAAPYALTISPDGKMLFAANSHDLSLTAIDVSAGNRSQIVSLGGAPRDLVYDPERRVVYVSLESTHEIVAVDSKLNVVSRYPLVASQPTGMALDAAGRRLYVAVRNAVVCLSLDSGTEVGRVAAPIGVNTLWLDTPSGLLYAGSGGGYVDLFHATPTQFSAIDEVQTQIRGHSVAYDAQRKFIYMPGGRDGRSQLVILKAVEERRALESPLPRP